MDGRGDDAELRRARSATTWKMIASAAVAGALSAVTVTMVHDARQGKARPSSVVTVPTQTFVTDASVATAAPAAGESGETGETGEQGAPGAPAATVTPAEPASTTTTTGADLDAGADAAEGGLALAAPTAVASAPPAAPPDAGPEDAGPEAVAEVDAGAAEARRGRDAGADAGIDPWAPPPMTAGAGRFTTEAPYWGASAFQSDPNAGAGRFTLEAPPWAASAFPPTDPSMGAGPFTTERNIPAFGGWPFVYALPYLLPPPEPPPNPPAP